MERDLIIVLDFGGQYKQLIARRVRECKVYCEIHPYTTGLDRLLSMRPKGIILTGGPNSVYDPQSPTYTADLFKAGIPVLGICYGSQLMAYKLGGRVETAPTSEYGHTVVTIDRQDSALFTDVGNPTSVWMSHTDYIAAVPEGFTVTAHTPVCPVAAMENAEKKLYAAQFHPEVTHSEEGMKMLRHFVLNVCGCRGDWEMASFAETTIRQLREQIGEDHVILGLSGGVDSSVAAALLSRAIGSQLHCVFVDHGLMRKDEGDEVEAIFGPGGNFDLDFTRVNARDTFFLQLMGESDPESKRKVIGAVFPQVFGDEARKFMGKVKYIAQGTIYPDVIESGSGSSAVIKSHHNVGGLPEHIAFREILEPLRMLFKDEVRQLGRELGLPEALISRQPFPGPGLAIRIIGDVTRRKLDIVREADAIFREELESAGNISNVSQYFAVLTNVRTVGVMGDGRTYEYTVALRCVSTDDFMTADWAHLPYDLLARASSRIVNEVEGVNRVVYDITSKPPATVEWE